MNFHTTHRFCDLFRTVLATVLAVALVFPSVAVSAATKDARSVVVFETEGDSVKITKGTPKEISAKAGQRLSDGYTVSTGKDSYCYLKLDEDSVVKMDQQSKLAVSKTSKDKLSLSVLSGSALVDAGPQAPGKTIETRVGNTGLTIRGTLFIVSQPQDGSGKIAITMLQGSGEVDGKILPEGSTMFVYDDNVAAEKVYSMLNVEVETMDLFTLLVVLDYKDMLMELNLISPEELELIPQLIQEKIEKLGDDMLPPELKMIILHSEEDLPELSGSDSAAANLKLTPTPVSPSPSGGGGGGGGGGGYQPDPPTISPTLIPTSVPVPTPTVTPTPAKTLPIPSDGVTVSLVNTEPNNGDLKAYYTAADFNTNPQEWIEIPDGGRVERYHGVYFEVTNIPDNKRIASFTINGVKQSNMAINDLGFGPHGVIASQDLTAKVVFEDVPSVLPALTGVQIKNKNNSTIYSTNDIVYAQPSFTGGTGDLHYIWEFAASASGPWTRSVYVDQNQSVASLRHDAQKHGLSSQNLWIRVTAKSINKFSTGGSFVSAAVKID